MVLDGRGRSGEYPMVHNVTLAGDISTRVEHYVRTGSLGKGYVITVQYGKLNLTFSLVLFRHSQGSYWE